MAAPVAKGFKAPAKTQAMGPPAEEAAPAAAPEEANIAPPETIPPPLASSPAPSHHSPHASVNSSPHTASEKPKDPSQNSIEAHRNLFAKNCYPSARECGECHQKIYDEWKISSHSYAMVSPMFQKFEQRITDLSQGTVGYFCYRCHAPVATSMGEDRTTPLWEMPLVSREGVTCIACHRINERYTKANGERRIVPGDIHAPVYGGIGGEGVAEVIAKKDHFKVKTSPDQQGAGQAIHLEGRYFDQLGKAEFCASCHQVAVHPGIKLEVVWEQYRQSPACKKGVTCQDCHMGLKPGVASGYEIGPIAEVGERASTSIASTPTTSSTVLTTRSATRAFSRSTRTPTAGRSPSGYGTTGGPAGGPTSSRTPWPTADWSPASPRRGRSPMTAATRGK